MLQPFCSFIKNIIEKNLILMLFLLQYFLRVYFHKSREIAVKNYAFRTGQNRASNFCRIITRNLDAIKRRRKAKEPSLWNVGYRGSLAFEDAKFTNWHLRHVYVRHYIGVELQRQEGYYEDLSRDTLLLGNRNQTLLNGSRSMTVVMMLVDRKSALYNQQYHQLGTSPRSIRNISFTVL